MSFADEFSKTVLDNSSKTVDVSKVNLNSVDGLTDEEIRKRNAKYIKEIVNNANEIKKRIGTEKLPDSYPAVADVAVENDMKETVTVDGLNTEKAYNPDDMYVKVKPTDKFIKDVQEKLKSQFDAPHRIINGKKVYDTYYYNIEAWCLELFFEAINWDVKIVEAVMNSKNQLLKNEVISVGFPTLAYWARSK